MEEKVYFRCTVCNDFHYGNNSPQICPTCSSIKAYLPVTELEADIALFEKQTRRGKNQWRLEEFLGILRDWCKDSDFSLNADEEHVYFTLDGVLRNERQTGLKYCPCRVPSGDFEKDLEVLCPCNFRIQEIWTEQARCWCGLFVDPGRYKKD